MNPGCHTFNGFLFPVSELCIFVTSHAAYICTATDKSSRRRRLLNGIIILLFVPAVLFFLGGGWSWRREIMSDKTAEYPFVSSIYLFIFYTRRHTKQSPCRGAPDNVWVNIWEVGVQEPRRCDGGGRRRWWWWWWRCWYSLHRAEKCVVILGSAYLISRAWSGVTAGGDSEHLHHKEALWKVEALVPFGAGAFACSCAEVQLGLVEHCLSRALWDLFLLFCHSVQNDQSDIKGWDRSKLKFQWWSAHTNDDGKSITTHFNNIAACP